MGGDGRSQKGSHLSTRVESPVLATPRAARTTAALPTRRARCPSLLQRRRRVEHVVARLREMAAVGLRSGGLEARVGEGVGEGLRVGKGGCEEWVRVGEGG